MAPSRLFTRSWNTSGEAKACATSFKCKFVFQKRQKLHRQIDVRGLDKPPSREIDLQFWRMAASELRLASATISQLRGANSSWIDETFFDLFGTIIWAGILHQCQLLFEMHSSAHCGNHCSTCLNHWLTIFFDQLCDAENEPVSIATIKRMVEKVMRRVPCRFASGTSSVAATRLPNRADVTTV